MVILLLDDNPDIIQLISAMIRRALGANQYEIVSGRDGREGLDILNTSEKTPDLIFTNLRMPNMDGLTFIKNVRLNDTWIKIPMVIMTAQQSPDVRREVLANGASAFLAKPFNFSEIKSTLESFGKAS
jgi:two-component system, chemotaxis family, chemotaxis protein CheY